MSVIPLTLTISLCLVFTFVLFFLREYSRQRFSSAESESLLPFADEQPRPAVVVAGHAHRDHDHHDHDHASGCGCERGERAPCVGCQRRLSAPPSTRA